MAVVIWEQKAGEKTNILNTTYLVFQVCQESSIIFLIK